MDTDNLTNFKINVMENGFLITCIRQNSFEYQSYVFKNCKDMRKWMADHLSATGEVRQFSDALDDNPEKETHFVGYNSVGTPATSVSMNMKPMVSNYHTGSGLVKRKPRKK
jgi:hypothetical protein